MEKQLIAGIRFKEESLKEMKTFFLLPVLQNILGASNGTAGEDEPMADAVQRLLLQELEKHSNWKDKSFWTGLHNLN